MIKTYHLDLSLQIENDRQPHIRLHERVNKLPDPNYATLNSCWLQMHATPRPGIDQFWYQEPLLSQYSAESFAAVSSMHFAPNYYVCCCRYIDDTIGKKKFRPHISIEALPSKGPS